MKRMLFCFACFVTGCPLWLYAATLEDTESRDGLVYADQDITVGSFAKEPVITNVYYNGGAAYVTGAVMPGASIIVQGRNLTAASPRPEIRLYRTGEEEIFYTECALEYVANDGRSLTISFEEEAWVYEQECSYQNTVDYALSVRGDDGFLQRFAVEYNDHLGPIITSVECDGMEGTIVPLSQTTLQGSRLNLIEEIVLYADDSCVAHCWVLDQDESSITLTFSAMDGEYFFGAGHEYVLRMVDVYCEWTEVPVELGYPDYAEKRAQSYAGQTVREVGPLNMRSPMDMSSPEGVIVTRSDNEEYYNRLGRIHTLTGVKTEVLTTHEIFAAACCYTTGEVEASRLIKQHLMDMSETSFPRGMTRCLLLGGHADYALGGVPSFHVYDNLVRSYDIYTDETSFLSDNYYADFSQWDSNGNGVHNDDRYDDPLCGYANMGVSRLTIPAVPGQFDVDDWCFQEKVITYLCGFNQARIDNILFLADSADLEDVVGSLDLSVNDAIWLNIYTEPRIPDEWSIRKLYEEAGNDDEDELTLESERDALEAGCNIAVYAGHGNTDALTCFWKTEGDFTSDMAYDLYNPDQFPIFMTCACLAGSIGEGVEVAGSCLVRAPFGGAIAYLGNSSVGLGPNGGMQLVDEMIEQIAEAEEEGENPLLADVFRNALNLFDNDENPYWFDETTWISDQSADWTRKSAVMHGDGLVPVHASRVDDAPDVAITQERFIGSDGSIIARFTVRVSPDYGDGVVVLHTESGNYYRAETGGDGLCRLSIDEDPTRIAVGYSSEHCLPQYREVYYYDATYTPGVSDACIPIDPLQEEDEEEGPVSVLGVNVSPDVLDPLVTAKDPADTLVVKSVLIGVP